MRIVGVGEEEFCKIFKFLGADTFTSEDPKKILEYLYQQIKKDALILLSSKISTLIEEELKEIKTTEKGAVIMELPSPSVEEYEEFDAKKVLYSVLGMKF
ncbi:MAG: hypothetical protein B6D55_05660 [Candidatus Omnitrophica bacterium 4484_70.2]|nr:MAG: hypothetical protein B6D55_05660 [Candidatus Omnitrophica bacterium 4484_70.2]